MSEISGDDEDLTAPPHGDAGEPPTAQLVGTVGGLVVEKADPMMAIAIGQFEFKRLFALSMAAQLIEAKENVAASETPKLAAALLSFLETGAATTDKKPALAAVEGGKK